MKWTAVFTAVLIVALLSGCGDPIWEGVAIGVGASEATGEATDMAKESKMQLIAEILRLRTELDAATTPEEAAALQEQLDAAEKKQATAELTESITASIKEGMGRDWSKPTSPNNLAWILGSAATVLGGLAGKKTLDDNKKAKALRRVTIAAKPEGEKEVYSAIEG